MNRSLLPPSLVTWLLTAVLALGASGCLRQVSASRYDEQRECFMEEEPAGLMSSGGCDDATTVRRGPDGDLWKFSQTCAPPKYEEVELSSDIRFAPYCDWPKATSPGDAGQMTDGNG